MGYHGCKTLTVFFVCVFWSFFVVVVVVFGLVFVLFCIFVWLFVCRCFCVVFGLGELL